ncbi:thioesterase family protein [Thermodesulfobacteriota bacterium]
MQQFDHSISLTQQAPFTFKGILSGDWSVNGNPHGGYLAAILANSVLQHSEKKSISIFTVNFISRCVVGEADISIENIGFSKHFDRWQARLAQNGQEKICAIGTFTNNERDQCEKVYEESEPVLLSIEECITIPEMPNYTIFDQMDIRLDPNCTGWMRGNLTDKSEVKGWIKFKGDRPFDELAILLIADSFPPAVIASQGMVAWVPSIELSVNIRNLATTQWLKCIFRSRFINNGIVEEDGQIWDETGELIAISRQIYQFRKNI